MSASQQRVTLVDTSSDEEDSSSDSSDIEGMPLMEPVDTPAEKSVEDKVKARREKEWKKEQAVKKAALSALEKAKEFHEHAKKFCDKKDITAAAFAIRKGIALIKSGTEEAEVALLETLQALLKSIRFAEAKILKLDGNSFYKKKRLDEATITYEQAIETLVEGSAPFSNEETLLLGQLYSNVSQTYLTTQDFKRAERALRSALQLDGFDQDAKVLYRMGICMLHKRRVHEAMEFALRAQRQQDDVATQKLIREIASVPTLGSDMLVLRDVRLGERVLHESSLVHTLRHYNEKVDRNYVNIFVQDLCKALEKESGKELDNVLRLTVSLVMEKKHTEYTEMYADDCDGGKSGGEENSYSDWIPLLSRHLNEISGAELSSLIALVERTRVDFDSPHVGVRGAGLFPSAGRIGKHRSDFNVDIVASTDGVMVTSLRKIKNGEKLVARESFTKATKEGITLDLSADSVDSIDSLESAHLWLSRLVEGVSENVFSKGRPVVSVRDQWPDFSEITPAYQKNLFGLFAKDPWARSFLATCFLMGCGAEVDQVRLAGHFAAYLKSVKEREKNFAKPWISTNYQTWAKFYTALSSEFWKSVNEEMEK